MASSTIALFLQHGSGASETLVLQEAVDELAAGVFLGVQFFEFGVTRQQHPALDMDEGGRHVDELGGELNVELGGPLDVFEVLLGDAGDGNVVDVDLLLTDEVQQ